jgi:hypothetical protein
LDSAFSIKVRDFFEDLWTWLSADITVYSESFLGVPPPIVRSSPNSAVPLQGFAPFTTHLSLVTHVFVVCCPLF